MTLTVAMYVTAPWWSLALPATWREGSNLLGGLLMFFQVMTNLAILTILARLHERPIVIALCALAGGAANAALALWWMPSMGSRGAAWAAGVGMYTGGLAVTAAYFALTRPRLSAGTYLVLGAPAILLAGPLAAGAIWLAVLAAGLATPLLLDNAQKQQFARRARALFARRRT
jgi:hypothetical protein